MTIISITKIRSANHAYSEMMISSKLCNFVLYRSPSQSSNEFENFFYHLDLTLEVLTQKNPFLIVIIVDFLVSGVLPIKQHLKGPS